MTAKTCTCRKREYATKDDAHTAMCATPERRFLNVYPCPTRSKVWHVGHRGRRLSPLLRLERAAKRGAS